MTSYRFLIAVFVAAQAVHAVRGADDRTIQITEIARTMRDVATEPAAVVEDIGDIRPLADKWLLQRLRVTASLRGEFTTNAKSIGDHGSGDFVLLPGLDTSFEQPIGHGLSLTLNARAESFIYSTFTQSSFWGFSGSTFLTYQPTKDCPKIYGGIEPYWYASVRNSNQLARAIGISAGVEKEWAFNRDQTVIFLGYNFTSYVSSPARDDRDSHRATVGVTQQIIPSLYGQFYYSYQFSDYTSVNRHDSRNLVGLNLVYRFNEHWTGSANTYFVDNDSKAVFASYQTFGIGLGASYQF
jgi:hypothetical protein